MSRILSAGLTVVAPVSVLAPARAAAQTAAGLSGPPSVWRLQVGVGGSWYENPRFLPGGDSASSWSTRGSVGLSTSQRFRTGTFSLSGQGGRLYYPEIDALGQWTYGGGASLALAPSPSTNLTLSQGYVRSNTRQLESLDQEGLPVPTTGVNNSSTGLGLTQRLSRRTQLEIDGSFTWRRYDNPVLIGGEQLRSTLGLARSVGQSDSIVIGYGFSQSQSQGRRGRVHVANLGVRHRPERGVSFELGGGAAYMESVRQWHPTGNAGLSASGREVSFSLRYARDFGLAFGYGRETIADRVSASLGWTPSERVGFHLGYSYGYRRDPADDGFRVRSHVGSAGLSWKIAGGLAFSASYSRELSRSGTFADVEGGRATASLSYGIDWR